MQPACKSTMIHGQKSSITQGLDLRQRGLPSGQGIRTQKWSNPLLCPVGGSGA